MTRLLASEFLRLTSRRMVRVLAIVAAASIVIGNVIGGVNSKPTSPLLLAQLPDLLKGIAFFLIVIGLIVGASSVGADWEQGTMGTLLVWEPRRTRVVMARTIAIVGVVLALTVLLEALFGLTFAAAAAWRGSTSELPGAWTGSVFGTAGRVAVAAAIAGVIGASIAWIGRNTTAALGAVFVYAAVVERLLRGLAPGWSPHMLGSGFVVFVIGHPADTGGGSMLGVGPAFVTLLAYAVILLVVGVVLFRSRDVT